jgi:hypothetical protein
MFYRVFQNKIQISSNDLSDCSICFIPYQGFYCAFLSHPTSKGLFLWSYSYGESKGILASHILLTQKLDSNEKQVVNLDQDVHVCGYFWWMVYELLFMNHLSPFFS